jgi:hypothetical protein
MKECRRRGKGRRFTRLLLVDRPPHISERCEHDTVIAITENDKSGVENDRFGRRDSETRCPQLLGIEKDGRDYLLAAEVKVLIRVCLILHAPVIRPMLTKNVALIVRASRLLSKAAICRIDSAPIRCECVKRELEYRLSA